MIIIVNKILPPKGFNAMAIFPFIFIREGVKATARLMNHEKIHFAQQKELFIVFFYILYGIFYLIYGYKNTPFEKEAYAYDQDEWYLDVRKYFSWTRFL